MEQRAFVGDMKQDLRIKLVLVVGLGLSVIGGILYLTAHQLSIPTNQGYAPEDALRVERLISLVGAWLGCCGTIALAIGTFVWCHGDGR